MNSFNQQIAQETFYVLREYKKDLLKKKGVVAVGRGQKIVKGRKTGLPCISVSVEKKTLLKEIKKKDRVPVFLKGTPTDVIETGVIKALHTQRHRPAIGGSSIGEKSITAGTFGCLVKKGHETFILSNNHVLACSNEAEIGADIIQPGSYDNGKYPEDHIAELAAFVPINMGGVQSTCPFGKAAQWVFNKLLALMKSHTRFEIIRIQEGDNLVDAAIARPLDLDWVSPEIMEIGEIEGLYIDMKIGTKIKKSGRTTGLTHGEIEQVNVTCKVQYGEGKIAVFEDQIMGGKMCAGGDSGSVVLTEDNHLVGLLFAGSETSMIANRIENVFSSLDITL